MKRSSEVMWNEVKWNEDLFQLVQQVFLILIQRIPWFKCSSINFLYSFFYPCIFSNNVLFSVVAIWRLLHHEQLLHTCCAYLSSFSSTEYSFPVSKIKKYSLKFSFTYFQQTKSWAKIQEEKIMSFCFWKKIRREFKWDLYMVKDYSKIPAASQISCDLK